MSELDLHQKLRIERILWAAGYYTRTNVKLATPVQGKPLDHKESVDLTDVDVLGIRFLEDLSPRSSVVDCKSGKHVSPIGRAFWLRGVMDHFSADRGYVVLARDIPEHQREAASDLNISLINETELSTLESRYPKLPENLRIGKTDSHNYLEGNLQNIPKSINKLREYRDTKFWYSNAPRAITQSITITRDTMNKLDFKQKFHKAIVMDVISLFAVASITLASEIIRLAPANLLDSLRLLIFGGSEGIARREQIISQFEEIVKKISLQSSLPIENELFKLDPPYLTYLADMLMRIIARPIDAAKSPRYLKIRLIHGILYDEWDIPLLLGPSYSPFADKIATDIAIAYLKSCGASKDIAMQLGFT